MNEIVTIAGWNPWPLVFPLLVLAGAAAVVIVGARRKRSPLIELGVFVALGAVVAGGLMTWGMSQSWDAAAQRVALASLGYSEAEIWAGGDERSGGQPVLAFNGVRDGQHGELGELRHISADQWEVVEF